MKNSTDEWQWSVILILAFLVALAILWIYLEQDLNTHRYESLMRIIDSHIELRHK